MKVFPDGEYVILDENEYEYHASVMNYPENVKKIISSQMEELLDLIVNKKEPFDFSYINDYIMKYLRISIITYVSMEKTSLSQMIYPMHL